MDNDEKIEEIVFNFSRLAELRTDHQMRVDALEARIDRLVYKARVNGQPIMSHILSFSHDAEELTVLGKALVRAATLLQELDVLHQEAAVFDLAASSPVRFASLFGDFSQNLETFLNTPTGD